MAQEYGARLLAEVQQCTLAEILAQLRSRRQPTRRLWTGVDYLDDLVETFAAGNQHAAPQPQPRPHPPHSNQHAAEESPQRTIPAQSAQSVHTNTNPKPPIIEITSTSPGSGQTELLYHLAATYLLGSPSQISPSSIPPSTIIYLSLTPRFSPTRLLTHLRTTLSRRPFTDPSVFDPDAAKAAQIESSTLAALDHVHVFQPQNSRSLVATLESLEAYILDVKGHYSGERPLGAILIEGLSAFYWEDRWDGEIGLARGSEEATKDESRESQYQRHQPPTPAGAAAATTATTTTNLLHSRWQSIVHHLRALQRTFSCPVITTNMALLKPQRTRDGLVAPPHLPGVWNAAVDVRVLISRERERFEGTMSAEEVLGRQKARRAEGESEGARRSALSRFRVNMWRCEDWGDEVRRRVAEVERAGWVLKLGEDGVRIGGGG